jgi:D-alanine-D-alanine ligase
LAKKIRVGILFGGKSAEHEVSLQSAKNIIEAIDQNQYEVVLIAIDKNGQWHLSDASRYLKNANDPKRIKLNALSDDVTLVPGENAGQLISLTSHEPAEPIDVVFPVLHGPLGEDGTVQGLLKIANVPFVGPGVLGSAVGMDKDVTKRLLREAGIPTAKFFVFDRFSMNQINFQEIKNGLGMPLFIKPANLGSSVGISKARDKKQFEQAVAVAFRYDNKIIIEEFIAGREIECSVLGNDDPIVSLPGEILPNDDFYSYEAKYINEDGADLEIPAKLSPDTKQRVQAIAVQTFKVLCCEGMARVDLFLKENDEIYVNEINTIPGFTKISMYPKLWEISGISYSELINRLIQLALQRFDRERKLETAMNI